MSCLLELNDIRFGYPGFEPCLDGASFALHEGERLTLTGHNGAGKSTLLHIIVGLNRLQAGEIRAFGRSYKGEKDFRLLRRRVGLVFQDPDDQLFCPTVAEDIAFGPLNLGYSKQEAMQIVDETLASLDLSAFRDRVTHKLSGGQKRLVSLATVLAMKPEILLLDEPTNALDEKTTQRLIDILVNLPQAMVIVSHDRQFRAAVETRSIQLEAGCIMSETEQA
ncbi:MAG: energy-coupling factor ABC transporter ATP-binding protein [Cohaesibacter sp.]|nr:energy-coupling factor ABC transporter ATP-binding protein [Cohaesibacter sp.]